MNTTDKRRCAHPACTCAVPAGDAYCSEHCRKRVESPTSDQAAGCHCGHADCHGGQATPSAQREPK